VQLSVASQDCDHVIQKLQSGYKFCVPSLLQARLASPIDRCHGGECNTPTCLQLATHRAPSCGTHRVVTHSRKMRFPAHGTSCAASPICCSSKEACSEEQGTIVTRRWSACRNGCVFWTVATMHVQRNTFCSVSFLTRAGVATQSDDKPCNWHADSSRRSIVQRSRERTTPRISS